MTELNFLQNSWRTVDYQNLQTVILENFGYPYNILEKESLTQTQNILKFIIMTEVSEEDTSALNTFINTGEGTGILRILMTHMAQQSWIDAGEYYITGW